MSRFNRSTSLLSGAAAAAMIPVVIANPKFVWVLASIALGLFVVIQQMKIRKFELRQLGDCEASND